MSNVRIRKMWLNTNSEKNQVTVQFAQEGVVSPLSIPKLGLIFQAVESKSSGRVTALQSVNADVATRLLGWTGQDVDYSDLPFAQWPTIEALEAEAGEALEINVVENTTQNPANPAQAPKINPETQEVLMYNGKPIYRHTELRLKSQIQRQFLQSNDVAVTTPVKANVLDAFGVGQEVGG